MAEYIEREDAIRVVNGQSSLTMTRSGLIDSISKLSAADVAPVTRCKDCRYRGLICCPAVHETMGNGLVDYAVDNGYCWCGKPKED